jgi:UDP-N-acetylglucosamine diphosphorylase/glucosamine-1-phosphate N-acetyltransferase
MYNVILFDDNYENLKPLTFTRPVSALRIGILTIREKWELLLDAKTPISVATSPHLAKKYPTHLEAEQNLAINAAILPTVALQHYLVNDMPNNCMLMKGDTVVALKATGNDTQAFLEGDFEARQKLQTDLELTQISYSWDIFGKNAYAMDLDYKLITRGRQSQTISTTNTVFGDSRNIFIEEGAWVECSILNATNGPIYIGKNATVMEGCIVRGGLALCEGATLKMGAKIYGATTIGPYSKIGGEVNNSVIIGYSNKGHDGFLGNAVIGQWCNLGADTNNSNLKNNYSEIKVWNYPSGGFINTGKQFCGLIMGDHSKSGINSMFNTGTTIGFFCNIYGSDFPRTFVPSFSWGSSKGFVTYQIDKAIETANRVMERRNKTLDAIEEDILRAIFEQTKGYRKY